MEKKAQILKEEEEAAIYLVDKTTKAPVPLERIHIDAKVVSCVAQFVMTQSYLNCEEEAIETLFLFPIDVTVVVSKITVDFKLPDGSSRFLETVIDAREKVEVRYEDAVASGKTAVIGQLTKTQRDMMRVSIGNFPALSRAVLKVHYYQQLEVEDLSYCLRIPMAYIPRYLGNIEGLLKTGQ